MFTLFHMKFVAKLMIKAGEETVYSFVLLRRYKIFKEHIFPSKHAHIVVKYCFCSASSVSSIDFIGNI